MRKPKLSRLDECILKLLDAQPGLDDVEIADIVGIPVFWVSCILRRLESYKAITGVRGAKSLEEGEK